MTEIKEGCNIPDLDVDDIELKTGEIVFKEMHDKFRAAIGKGYYPRTLILHTNYYNNLMIYLTSHFPETNLKRTDKILGMNVITTDILNTIEVY